MSAIAPAQLLGLHRTRLLEIMARCRKIDDDIVVALCGADVGNRSPRLIEARKAAATTLALAHRRYAATLARIEARQKRDLESFRSHLSLVETKLAEAVTRDDDAYAAYWQTQKNKIQERIRTISDLNAAWPDLDGVREAEELHKEIGPPF